MNKRFFYLKNDLTIKSILAYLNISEEIFYKYNKKNKNILDFKINQFSSLSNSFNDSLIFINKSISDDLRNINGVCLINVSIQNYHFQNTIVIPSQNPKLDFCNLIDQFCRKKEKNLKCVKLIIH